MSNTITLHVKVPKELWQRCKVKAGAEAPTGYKITTPGLVVLVLENYIKEHSPL